MNTFTVSFAMLALLSVPFAQADSGLSDSINETVKVAEENLLGNAMTDDALASQRGKATVVNLSDLDAVVAGNAAIDVVTGGNALDAGSLVGNSGFSTVIQNSGNNVLIQNSLILNIQLQ